MVRSGQLVSNIRHKLVRSSVERASPRKLECTHWQKRFSIAIRQYVQFQRETRLERFVWIPTLFAIGLAIVYFISQAREQKREAREQAEYWQKIRAMDYVWYVGEHPACKTGNSVLCFACGSNNLRVERLMQQTYLRKHYCGRCGTSLYYSTEV